MLSPHIQIVDSDPMAALVTQLGLQACLKTEADIKIVPDPMRGQGNGNGERVDLLIVDPGAQSQAATAMVRTLQTRHPETPLLVLTAYDSPRLRSQMRRLGVHCYLAKPVGVSDLENVVRSMMYGKEMVVDTSE